MRVNKKNFVVVEQLILLQSQWSEFPLGSSTVYVWVMLFLRLTWFPTKYDINLSLCNVIFRSFGLLYDSYSVSRKMIT